MTVSSDIYEVDRILGRRYVGAFQSEYKVKWLGWGEEQATWEPREHLLHHGAVAVLRSYEQLT